MKFILFLKNIFVFYVSLIGRVVLFFFDCFGNLCMFTYTVIVNIFERPFYFKNTINVFLYCLIRGLPIVALASFFVGAVMALQSHNGFARMNAQSSIPVVIALSFARELGPVVTGFTMCGSIGASMASELSGMVVNSQISAMRTLLVNPFKFLIVPNIVASVLVLPILTFVADVIGFLGGYVVCIQWFDFSSTNYINTAFSMLELSDVFSGLFKSIWFGFALSLISSYFGYNSDRDAIGIGKATISAVTNSGAMILILNYILTAVLF